MLVLLSLDLFSVIDGDRGELDDEDDDVMVVEVVVGQLSDHILMTAFVSMMSTQEAGTPAMR